jgi:hypothetical protein
MALEHDEERYFCGLFSRPSHYLKLRFDGDVILQPLIQEALGIGTDCDSELLKEKD